MTFDSETLMLAIRFGHRVAVHAATLREAGGNWALDALWENEALRAEVQRLRAIEAAARRLMVPYTRRRCSQRNQWVCFLPSGQRVLLTIDSVAALQAALAAKETP